MNDKLDYNLVIILIMLLVLTLLAIANPIFIKWLLFNIIITTYFLLGNLINNKKDK